MVSLKSNKITPPKTSQNDKVLIGDENMGPEKIEFVCSFCSRVLVKIKDTGGANEQLFCSHCSIPYDMDDESVRHKQRLSVPEQTEPDITSVGTVPDVSIRHSVRLRGAFAAMAKKGTIKFTSYSTTEKQ